MKESKIHIIAFVIFVIVTSLYFVNKMNERREGFLPKVNQFWRPHYRNLKAWTVQSYQSGTGSAKRFLRKTGIL